MSEFDPNCSLLSVDDTILVGLKFSEHWNLAILLVNLPIININNSTKTIDKNEIPPNTSQTSRFIFVIVVILKKIDYVGRNGIPETKGSDKKVSTVNPSQVHSKYHNHNNYIIIGLHCRYRSKCIPSGADSKVPWNFKTHKKLCGCCYLLGMRCVDCWNNGWFYGLVVLWDSVVVWHFNWICVLGETK